jgi:hypothetical protein
MGDVLGIYNWKSARVALSPFQRHLDKSANVRCDHRAARLPITSRTTPAAIGKRQAEMRRQLLFNTSCHPKKKKIGKCLVWVA